MKLFQISIKRARDPYMTNKPMDFIEKENIHLIHEEFDIKRIFESSFEVDEIKKPLAIIETIDGAFHSILEVQPIKYNSLEPILQKEIQREYFNFLSNIDFPWGVMRRVVNDNVTAKITTLLNKIEYKLKQKKSKDLLKSFKPVSNFIINLSKKCNKKVKKYYIFISFKLPVKTKTNIEERTRKVLGERAAFIISSLKKAKLNNITPLTQSAAYNLFLSLIKDYIYNGSTYLTPTNWLQVFYQKGEKND